MIRTRLLPRRFREEDFPGAPNHELPTHVQNPTPIVDNKAPFVSLFGLRSNRKPIVTTRGRTGNTTTSTATIQPPVASVAWTTRPYGRKLFTLRLKAREHRERRNASNESHLSIGPADSCPLPSQLAQDNSLRKNTVISPLENINVINAASSATNGSATQTALEVQPERLDPTLEGAVPVEAASPTIYFLDRGTVVGKLKDIPLPPMIEEEWFEEKYEQIIKDLRPVSERLLGSISGQEAIIEPVLCMTGLWDQKSSHIQLLPTIWIRCGSKTCKDAVQNAVDTLPYLHAFSKGRIQVHVRAPRFASRIESALRAADTLASAPMGRVRLSIHIPENQPGSSRRSTWSTSACGLRLRYTSGQQGVPDRTWVMGGVIKVGRVVYGLTTAHSMFDALFAGGENENGNENENGTYDGVDGEIGSEADVSSSVAHDYPQTPPTETHTKHVFHSRRSTIPMNYAGLTNSGVTSKPVVGFGASDFALIPLQPPVTALHNYYQASASDDHQHPTNPCVIDKVTLDLSPGSVSIICSASDVKIGYLLKGHALIIVGKSVFRTRKIQTETPLGVGASGTWVVRGSSLLGMIVAVYDNEPYVHILPMGEVFADIQALLKEDGGVPQIDFPTGDTVKEDVANSDRLDANGTCVDPSFLKTEESPRGNDKDKKKEEESGSSTSQPPVSPRRSTSKLILLLGYAALIVATFSVGLDLTAFPTIMPIITDQFSSLRHVGWYGSAYFMAMSITYPNVTRLLGGYWTEVLHLASLAIFGAGCLLGIVADRSFIFIIGRALSGIGAAGTLSSASYIVYEEAPKERRDLCISVLRLGNIAGRLLGPFISSNFTGKEPWKRWFLLNGFIAFIAGVISLVLWIRNIRNVRFIDLWNNIKPFWNDILHSRMRRINILLLHPLIDIFGNVLLVGFSICLSFALYIGSPGFWREMPVVGLYIGSALCAIAFVFTQTLVGDKATIPFRRFGWRIWVNAFLSAMWGAGFYAWNHFFPTWSQAIKGTKGPTTGATYLPTLIPLFVMPLVASYLFLWMPPHVRYMSKRRSRRAMEDALETFPRRDFTTSKGRFFSLATSGIPLLSCLAWMALGSGLCSTFSPTTASKTWIGYQLIFGLGAGAGTYQAITAVRLALKSEQPTTQDRRFVRDDTVVATDVILLSESLGGAIAITAAQTVLMSQLHSRRIEHLLDAGATSYKKLLIGQELEITVNAFNAALTRTFFVSTAAGALPFAILAVIAISVCGLMLTPYGPAGWIMYKRRKERKRQLPPPTSDIIELRSKRENDGTR